MNARRNHCTSKILVALSALICAHTSFAQNLWEEGRNVAGESIGAEIGQSTDAYLGGRFTSGEFRTPSEGKTLWTAEAKADGTASFNNLYLKGNFGFELTRGDDMMGSMFTEPGYYPFDILEFTPGVKIRQTYDIAGSLAWKNSSRWTPGGTLRFRGINYAKRKDLRHTTYRQEIELAPSVHYKGDVLQLGLSGILEKNSEFITAEQVGQAQTEPYWAFLDKGMRYGTLQVWDASGIHLKDSGLDRFPVKQMKYGAALQTSAGELFYADVEYVYSFGEVGEKGYTWFRFPGHDIAAKLIFNLRSRHAAHVLRLDYQWHYLDNHEIIMDKENVGGVTIPKECGSNYIFRNRSFIVTPSYKIEHDKGWTLEGAVSIIRAMDMSTLMYPFYDDDRSIHINAEVLGTVPIGKFTLSGGASFFHLLGDHWHFMDDVDPKLGLLSEPFRLKDWWDLEQEKDDATHFTLNASVKYSFGPSLYAEAGCHWLHAFNITLLSGCDRQTTYLKFGYSF